MRIRNSDRAIAWLTLLSGLTISAVAIYYSVAGLVAIFAAAAIPIIIMGVVLEVGKLVATVWLKMNWTRAPRLIRTYLIIAITTLMLITSMGIFGFLSKAHLDQAVPTGDIADKVALIDEKIKTERDNIDAAKKALTQMDSQVDQILGRSADEKGAERAVQIRRNQAKERQNLQNEIAKSQKAIAVLNEERAPIAKDLRKVEAEVGPIKYIAKLIYGDNPDANLLEKAVTWVIMIIVFVFDPLAVVLLLASQHSFQWFRKEKDSEEDLITSQTENNNDQAEPLENKKESFYQNVNSFWPFPKYQDNKKEDLFETIKYNEKVQEAPYHPGYEDVTIKDDAGLDDNLVDEDIEKSDQEILDAAVENEKQAMKAWKHDHPDSSLKIQRRLFEHGKIDHLPWEDYLKPKADFSDNDAAEEAAKWAQEQIEKKNSDSASSEISWMEHDEQGNQIKKTKDGYQQNAEQSERTIWQRIQDAKK